MPASEAVSTRHQFVLVAAAAVAHGLLFALAFPDVGLWPLSFVAVAPLVWLATVCRASTRLILLTVGGVQTGLWLWLNWWLVDVTAAGYVLLAFYMSGYAVAFIWLVRSISRSFAWPAAMVAPVIWVGLECARGELLFYGYPWFLIAHPLGAWPIVMQSADLFGVYFVSFLVVMVGGLSVDLVRGLSRRALIAAVAVTLGVQVANLLYGVLRVAGDAAEGPLALAIQTNLPQDNKLSWSPAQQLNDVRTFVDLTLEAAAAAPVRPDFVVWPETMLPGFGLEPDAIRRSVQRGLVEPEVFARTAEQLAALLGAPLLVGSPAYVGMRVEDGQWVWDKAYNSVYLVDGAPPYQRYDKSFLMPFGETMPYISSWPWLERRLLAIGAGGMSFDLEVNPVTTRLEIPWRNRTVVLATAICFENAMGRVCRRLVYERGRKLADVLVNVSNEGWFGRNDSGRSQHLQIARFRCVENRVPMIRSVNTGVSVAIDSSGRFIGPASVSGEGVAVPSHEAGWVLAELPLDHRSTLYGRLGDTFAWTCLLATAGLWSAAMIARRRGSTT
jgi:apolipoprotein N-acyltransferase